VIVLGSWMLSGCLSVPLGNPEQSKVDPKLEGFWAYEEEQEGMIVGVYPFDGRAYVIDCVSFAKKDGARERKDRALYKGWITEVAGQKFMTLEPMAQRLASTTSEKKLYAVERLKLDKDTLEIRMVSDDFTPVKEATTPEALLAAIRGNLNDPALYSKDAQTFHRLDPEKDQEKTEALLKLF
jgi:hypothetical protein